MIKPNMIRMIRPNMIRPIHKKSDVIKVYSHKGKFPYFSSTEFCDCNVGVVIGVPKPDVFWVKYIVLIGDEKQDVCWSSNLEVWPDEV